MKTLSGWLVACAIGLCLNSCISTDEPTPSDCDASPSVFTVTQVVHATSCASADGSISVEGTQGEEPYSFSINGGPYQASTTFASLIPGTYTVAMKDAFGCESTQGVIVTGPTGLTLGTPDATASGCESSFGTIMASAMGGTSPFEYQLEGGAFQESGFFDNLSAGDYSVTVRDSEGCESSATAAVLSGTSYSSQIVPIITARCSLNGCHDGDLGPGRNWTLYSNVRNNAEAIKERTAEKSMPPGGSTPLTDDEISLIACWVDDGASNN